MMYDMFEPEALLKIINATPNYVLNKAYFS